MLGRSLDRWERLISAIVELAATRERGYRNSPKLQLVPQSNGADLHRPVQPP
jgi:hypothetical protein